jgi:ABC-type sugar transport system substrate-binding protein
LAREAAGTALGAGLLAGLLDLGEDFLARRVGRAVALATATVMFSVETSTSPSWVAQRRSAERSAAMNPRSIKLSSFEDSSPRQDSRQ